MGDQLYAVVFKRRVEYLTKTGKRRWKWERCYRAPRAEDDNAARDLGAARREDAGVGGVRPMCRGERDSRGLRMTDRTAPVWDAVRWRDLFSPRQLLCHGTSVEVFREMLEEDRQAGRLDDVRTAAYGYLALTLDTLVELQQPDRDPLACNIDGASWLVHIRQARLRLSNGRMQKWRHWLTGVGYDWAIGQDGEVHQGACRADPARGRLASDGQLFQSAPPVASNGHVQAGRPVGPHRNRVRGCRRHGPALLRQRHVRRAFGLLLRVAQAHCGARVPRAVPALAHGQGERSGRQSGAGTAARRARERSPRATTGSGWPRSSPSAAEC